MLHQRLSQSRKTNKGWRDHEVPWQENTKAGKVWKEE